MKPATPRPRAAEDRRRSKTAEPPAGPAPGAGPSRPGLHAFERAGRCFVYLVGDGSVCETSRAAFEALRAIESSGRPIRAAIDDLRRSGHADEVVDEIAALERSGAFDPRDRPLGRAEELAAVDHLIDHRSRSLQLLVETTCNLACTYCYEARSGFHESGRGMSPRTWRRAVDLAFARAGDRPTVDLILFGGEPLLQVPTVEAIVAYARERGAALGKEVSFRITTNGHFIDERVAEFLAAERFAVMVSVDGPPELADRNRVDRGGRGATQRSIDGALLLLAAQRRHGVRELMIRATMT